MASCCQPRCEYCGVAGCVGRYCPQWDDDVFDDLDRVEDDFGLCELCGVSLRVGEMDGICVRCATRDHVIGEGEDDVLDHRDYEADQ